MKHDISDRENKMQVEGWSTSKALANDDWSRREQVVVSTSMHWTEWRDLGAVPEHQRRLDEISAFVIQVDTAIGFKSAHVGSIPQC